MKTRAELEIKRFRLKKLTRSQTKLSEKHKAKTIDYLSHAHTKIKSSSFFKCLPYKIPPIKNQNIRKYYTYIET